MTGPVAMILTAGVWIALVFGLGTRAQARVGDDPSRATRVATLLCSVAAVAIALAQPGTTQFLRAIACSALVVAAFADARTGLLFDAITFPSAIVTAVAAVTCGAGSSAAVGVLTLVGGFGALVAVSRGTAMGLGDVKAMYAIGAAFGPMLALVAVAAACFSGIAAALLMRRMTRKSEIRFGPHLAVGSVFTLIAGDPIVHGLLGR